MRVWISIKQVQLQLGAQILVTSKQLAGCTCDRGHASDDDISRETTRITQSLRDTSPQTPAVKPYYSFARLR
jgi:hypothetical protein